MGNGLESASGIPFIGIDLLTALTLVTLGFLGGMLSGFIGSGGAFVLTPGMMNLGVLGPVAVASNMCHKFPKAIVGAWKRRKLGHVDIKLGVVMAISSIVGVKVGVGVQDAIMKAWGQAGSNLYISATFVIVLVVVGGLILKDVRKSSFSGENDSTSSLAKRIASLNIPPMLEFKQAGARVTFWVTVPTGFATGMLAATIAVGGFIGVPSMIYIIGAPGFVASGTELVIAFFMGLLGTYEWAVRGFVDIRLTALLLAGSLVGVQLGAIGTSYVKEYMIKLVTAVVMLLAAISRAVMIPAYLADVKAITMSAEMHKLLENVSLVILYGTLAVAATVIVMAVIKGKRERDKLLAKPVPVLSAADGADRR